MKLRIRSNSVRLRLTKNEAAEIGGGGTVKETIEFGSDPAQHLSYALIPTDAVETPNVVFEGRRISIFIPKSQAENWARTNQISIEAEKSTGENKRALRILIEKDFSCLEPRAGEEDSDTFPHPLQNETPDKIQLENLE